MSRWCNGVIGEAHVGKWIPKSELMTSGYPIFSQFNDVDGLYVCRGCGKKLNWSKKLSDNSLRKP